MVCPLKDIDDLVFSQMDHNQEDSMAFPSSCDMRFGSITRSHNILDWIYL